MDEFSLQVELKSPTPYFLELTAHTIYSPIPRLTDQLHPNWPSEEGHAYVCNGAFQLIKNRPNAGYELIKNFLYWDAENIHLDQVNFFKMNCHQAFERFETNSNHWVGSPLSAWDSHFIPSEDDELVDFLSKGVCWYTFNCKKPPFNHKKMRQAFSLAIDREKLAPLFNIRPAISPLPSEHSFAQQSLSTCFNPQKAKVLFTEALEEMAIAKENFAPFTLIHVAGSTGSKLAEAIKIFWETTFHIQCHIESLKWNTLFTNILEGDYQVGSILWQPWVNDPMYTLNAFRNAHEPINFSKWEHEKYQEILLLAEKEIKHQKRQDYYLQAERILLEEMPVIPIFSSSIQTLKKKNLKINCSSNFMNFKWAYFESPFS